MNKKELEKLKGFEVKEDTESLYKAVKDNPKDKIELELGDSKDNAKLHPQAKIKRWNNEVNLSVRFQDDDKSEKDIKVEKNVLEWVGDKKEVHIYEKPEIAEDGGLEMEVVLKEKPISNVIEFSIETKGLNFYKQPEGSLFTEPVSVDYIVDEIKSYNPESVLDLGGNTGEVVKKLVSEGIDATCLDNSREGYKNRVTENYIFADITKGIPLEDKSVDLITAYGVLPYLPKETLDFVLSEIVRVSKRAVISFNWNSSPNDLGEILNWHEKDWYVSKFKEIDSNFYNEILTVETSERIPENVKGSYAVYHQSKSGNYPNVEYRTGKFCHIYRPKVTDAENNSIWGELNIDLEKKLLTVTIDEEWLNNAIYPVVVDPTFGYTSAGAENYGRSGLSGTTIFSFYNAYTGGTGTGVSMSIYCGSVFYPTGCGIQMAIYNSSNELVDYTETINPTSYDWHDANLELNADLTASNYYLYFNEDNISTTDPTAMQSFSVAYDANVGYRTASVSSFGTWPSTISPSLDTMTKRQYSIYVTYTESGTPIIGVKYPLPPFKRP